MKQNPNRVRRESTSAAKPRQLKLQPQLPDLHRQVIASAGLNDEERLLIERTRGKELFFIEREREYYFYRGAWRSRFMVEHWRKKKRSVVTQRRVSTQAAVIWLVEELIPEVVRHHFTAFTLAKGGAR